MDQQNETLTDYHIIILQNLRFYVVKDIYVNVFFQFKKTDYEIFVELDQI